MNNRFRSMRSCLKKYVMQLSRRYYVIIENVSFRLTVSVHIAVFADEVSDTFTFVSMVSVNTGSTVKTWIGSNTGIMF